MICKKCGRDFKLSTDLNGLENLEEVSYFQCAKCGDIFCPEHIKSKILVSTDSNGNPSIVVDDKIHFVQLCDKCYNTV
jgi:hypothetical protein